MSSEDFGLLRKTSDFFGNVRKRSCHLQKSQHSQDKNLTPISQKKLAGIQMGTGEFNAGGYPCDGLASHPGGVEILSVASC